jgi:hypothetical protein
MGGQLAADGILRGDVVTETVNCNTQAGNVSVLRLGADIILIYPIAMRLKGPAPYASQLPASL